MKHGLKWMVLKQYAWIKYTRMQFLDLACYIRLVLQMTGPLKQLWQAWDASLVLISYGIIDFKAQLIIFISIRLFSSKFFIYNSSSVQGSNI